MNYLTPWFYTYTRVKKYRKYNIFFFLLFKHITVHIFTEIRQNILV